MATQLSVYNQALEVLGEVPMTVLTEQRPARRLLDNIWNNGGVEACLAQGYWNFAARSVEMSYDPDVTPTFGYRYSFSKPDDYIKVMKLCTDEYMTSTLERYEEEGPYFMAEYPTLYMQYVSKDASFGLNLSSWDEPFATFVAYYFANRTKNTHVKDSKRRREIMEEAKKALLDARNFDAMNQPALQPQEGRWSRTRRGRSSHRDRGSRSSLTG